MQGWASISRIVMILTLLVGLSAATPAFADWSAGSLLSAGTSAGQKATSNSVVYLKNNSTVQKQTSKISDFDPHSPQDILSRAKTMQSAHAEAFNQLLSGEKSRIASALSALKKYSPGSLINSAKSQVTSAVSSATSSATSAVQSNSTVSTGTTIYNTSTDAAKNNPNVFTNFH